MSQHTQIQFFISSVPFAGPPTHGSSKSSLSGRFRECVGMRCSYQEVFKTRLWQGEKDHNGEGKECIQSSTESGWNYEEEYLVMSQPHEDSWVMSVPHSLTTCLTLTYLTILTQEVSTIWLNQDFKRIHFILKMSLESYLWTFFKYWIPWCFRSYWSSLLISPESLYKPHEIYLTRRKYVSQWKRNLFWKENYLKNIIYAKNTMISIFFYLCSV